MVLVWLGGKEGNILCLDGKYTEQESVSEGWLACLCFMEGQEAKSSIHLAFTFFPFELWARGSSFKLQTKICGD